MENLNITPGELKMIQIIAKSEYRDDYDLTVPVWSPVCTPSEKGYLSSCIKKGFVDIEQSQDIVWLTPIGIEIYNSKRLTDEA